MYIKSCARIVITSNKRINNLKLELQNTVIIFIGIHLLVITEHRLQMTHEFDWNNIQILDEQACYNKRLISEMLNI